MVRCSRCPKDAWFQGLCKSCLAAEKKRKAEREGWRDDRFIRKKWAKQAKARRLGAALVAQKKAERKARDKLKKLRRRARMNAGGPLRDYDEDYQFEFDRREER